MNFNDAQRRAIEHRTGPMLVLAGPGSGKTAVITERAKCLAESGVNPRKILVVTFTKAAALEMKERFLAKMNQTYAPVQFGTFHAIFFSILKHAYHYSANQIIHADLKHQFFREILQKYQLDIQDENEFISDLESEISLVKGEMMPLEHFYSSNCAADVFRNIITDYNTMLQSKHLLDFDDMLVYCYELLTQREDILSIWQDQFEYILIDEFQDINQVQYEIVKLLVKPHKNIFVVGDDDQSIYRFRGAKPEIMLHFEKDFKNTQRVLLDTNYRCSEKIVKAASKVIKNNQTRFSKQITAYQKGGNPVSVMTFAGLKEQNRHVAEGIVKLHEEGVPYDEIAVLFRTNSQPRALMELLMIYNIPFHMQDVIPNIYDHWIAQDMFSYIKIAMGSRDRKLFLRLANRPKRYISRDAFEYPEVSFEDIKTFYQDKDYMLERIDQWEYDMEWLKKQPPYAALQYIRRGIGYDEYLREYAEYRRIREEDLFEVLDEIMEAAKPLKSFEEWFAHIEQYKEELEQQKRKDKADKEAVMLQTMHRSKGLEYDTVFIIDANEGIMPHNKAAIPADIEEERRLFYVAMTRAKRQLFIYYSKERYNKKMEPSRFVKELIGEESKKSRTAY